MYTSEIPTQKIFRILVDAMSHPGRVYNLPPYQMYNNCNNSLMSVAYTLLDNEVTFAFIGRNSVIAEEVYAATKARLAPITEAQYVIIEGNNSFGQIDKVNCGTNEYPDKGATLVYFFSENNDIQSSKYSNILLSGPGIKKPIPPQLSGMSVYELAQITLLNTEFPLGVDCIFLSSHNKLMCIPRSTKITMKNQD